MLQITTLIQVIWKTNIMKLKKNLDSTQDTSELNKTLVFNWPFIWISIKGITH